MTLPKSTSPQSVPPESTRPESSLPTTSLLTVLVWAMLAGSVLLIFVLGQVRFFDHDEFEAMHTTWKMFTGQEIYIDFLQHHHPFTYYLLLPLYNVFGAGTQVLLAGRVLMGVLLTLTLGTTYLIAFELYRDHLIAVTSTLFLSGFALFLDKMIEIRPDVPMSFVSLLGTYLALRGLRTRQWWLFALSGACFGLGLMFLQKAVVPLFGLGLVLLARIFSKQLSWREVVIFGASTLIPVAPYVLYLLLAGKLETFFFFNFTYNTLYYRLRGWELYKLIRNLGTLYRHNIIMIVFFLYLSFFLPKKRREWELLFLIASVLGFTMLTGRHNPQYYILAFPFIAIMAAYTFWDMLRPRPVIAAFMLILIVGGPLERYYGFLTTADSSNRRHLGRIERVLSLTEPDDYVYDGNIMFNLFRRDVDFIWYMTGEPYKAIETMETLADYDYDIYERIERLEPKVISSFGIDNMAHPVIAEHYEPDEVLEDIYVRRSDPADTPGTD